MSNEFNNVAAADLDRLVLSAKASPRRRANLNLHADLADSHQRLAIAMQPETLILPHRHRQTFETLIPLRGRFIVLTFDDSGTVERRVVLGAETALLEMTAGTWHAVLSCDDGGIIFETKRGPYRPLEPEDQAAWLPADPESVRAELLAWYAHARPGDVFARA